MSVASLSIITLLLNNCHGASWGYKAKDNNASHWPAHAAECGYRRQSPIDLDISIYDECAEPLELDWVSQESHYIIRNNGHSLQATPFEISHKGGPDTSGLEILHHTNDTVFRLQNAFYNTYTDRVHKEYCFDSLHFHWGRTDETGSEHTVNGIQYPLEVHLVHYACDFYTAGEAIGAYASGEQAANYDDENVLAVIGVIFEIGEANPVLTKMLDDLIIDGIAEKRSPDYYNTNYEDHGLLELYYTHFNIAGLLPESKEMVAYLGSLTTPPCFETVRWHVMKERMTVSVEQMEQFRMMLMSEDMNDTMAPNFRPVLPMNGRTLYKCIQQVEHEEVEKKPIETVAEVVPEENEDTDDGVVTIEDEETEEEGDEDEVEEDDAGTFRIIFITFGALFLILGVVIGIGLFRRGSVQKQESVKSSKYMGATMGI